MPATKKIIRGDCPIGGWILEPVGDRETKGTVMIELDLKGSLPGWVLTQANKDQGYQIQRVREAIKQFMADHNLK